MNKPEMMQDGDVKVSREYLRRLIEDKAELLEALQNLADCAYYIAGRGFVGHKQRAEAEAETITQCNRARAAIAKATQS